jgi:hypothetical protein
MKDEDSFSAGAGELRMTTCVTATATTVTESPRLDTRTRRLLKAPVVSLLLGMTWPNMLIMLAQPSTGVIETWFVWPSSVRRRWRVWRTDRRGRALGCMVPIEDVAAPHSLIQ